MKKESKKQNAKKRGKRLQLVLLPKQELFCQEYVKSGMLQESAIAAGYSPTSAAVTASELIRNPVVKDRIKVLQELASIQLDFTKNHILADLKNLKEDAKNDPEKRDRRTELQALDMVNKLLGHYQQETTTQTNVNIVFGFGDLTTELDEPVLTHSTPTFLDSSINDAITDIEYTESPNWSDTEPEDVPDAD